MKLSPSMFTCFVFQHWHLEKINHQLNNFFLSFCDKLLENKVSVHFWEKNSNALTLSCVWNLVLCDSYIWQGHSLLHTVDKIDTTLFSTRGDINSFGKFECLPIKNRDDQKTFTSQRSFFLYKIYNYTTNTWTK